MSSSSSNIASVFCLSRGQIVKLMTGVGGAMGSALRCAMRRGHGPAMHEDVVQTDENVEPLVENVEAWARFA